MMADYRGTSSIRIQHSVPLMCGVSWIGHPAHEH
jgi:hypothetical protein